MAMASDKTQYVVALIAEFAILDQDKLEGLIFFYGKWGSYDLINATNSVEERIALCCGHTEHIKLKIVWDDDFSKNRETILNVQLS